MNVLVYYPNGYRKRVSIEWLYGIDIIKALEDQHPEWNFIYVNGTQKDIYENADILLRPNRHDGFPKMIAEAKKID